MKDLVLLSGGLDSATALADRCAAGTARLAVSVDYGQRQLIEVHYAARLARHYDVPHTTVDMSGWGALVAKPGALTGAATIVPNRNALLLSVAASLALVNQCDRVVFAVHAGDHAVYPDCRPAFVLAANTMLAFATEHAVKVHAPFLYWPKERIAQHAIELNVPIVDTWSCYDNMAVHCGTCDACVNRRAAFKAVDVVDPTEYAPCM